MSKLIPFAAGFGVVGASVALALNALWWIFERSISSDSIYTLALKATLFLFPASIGTIAISGSSYWDAAHFALIALNAIFYLGIGVLTWLGLRRSKVYFVCEGVIVIALIGWIVMLH